MEVKLGIYGQEAANVMEAVIYRHNSCKSTNDSTAKCMVQRKKDDEIVLFCNKYRFQLHTFGYSMKKAIEGWTLGKVTGRNFKDHMDDTVEIEYYPEYHYDFNGHVEQSSGTKKITTTIRFLRCLYEVIMKRDKDKLIRLYGEEMYNKVAGRPANPFVILQRQQLLQEKDRLIEAYRKKKQELYDKRSAEIQEVRDKWDKVIDEVSAEQKAEIAKIDVILKAEEQPQAVAAVAC